MKAIMVVTDSEAVPAFERAFVARKRGFTVIPGLVGMGRSGLKTGDRIHPGGSSILLTVVSEEDLGDAVTMLRGARAESGYASETRMWSFAAEEIA